MIICHCHGVSDRAIKRAVRNGAATRDDVARSCGAGSCCGGCSDSIDDILASHTESLTIEIVSLAEYAPAS